MQRAYKVWLSQEQEDDLQRFARSRTLPARLVERSKMLLSCAAGNATVEIAEELGVARQTVSRWLGRYVEQGLKGIEKDAPRSGRPVRIEPAKVAELSRRRRGRHPWAPPIGARARWPR